MYQDLGDRLGYARSTQQLAQVVEGKYEKDIARKLSAAYFAESAAIFRELGAEKDLAFALWEWGLFKRSFPDELEEARSMLEEAERLYRKLGSWFIGGVQATPGLGVLETGPTGAGAQPVSSRD